MKNYMSIPIIISIIIVVLAFSSTPGASYPREAETKKHPEIETRLLNLMARVCIMWGRYNTGLECAQKALDTAEKLNAIDLKRDACLAMSDILTDMDRHAEALGYYKRFKSLHDQIQNDSNLQKAREIETRRLMLRKEREIELLKKERRLQEMDINHQKSVTHSLIVISIMVMLLGLSFYCRYRLKRRGTNTLKTEVAAHKRTTGQLIESEDMFRALAEQALVGIFIIQDNVIKYVNPYFYYISGMETGELLNRSPLDFIHEEDRAPVSKRLADQMKGKADTNGFRFRAVRKDSSMLHIETYATAMVYEGKPALLGTLADVSLRVMLEEELNKKRELEMVGTLAGGIAHDFNNLLGTIIGYIYMAGEELSNRPRTGKRLKNAEKAARKTAELVNSIIAYAGGSDVATG